MSGSLKFEYEGMKFEMPEVGDFSWSKTQDGAVSMTAAPPGVVVAPTAARGVSRGGGGLAAAATPALKALASDLKERSKASAEKARVAAEAKEAAQAQADA